MSSEPVVTEFGPNEWLVDELYQQYLSDKSSVDPAWWEFFADYQPAETPHLRTSSRPSDDSNSDPSDTIPATGPNGAVEGRPVATAIERCD